MRKIKADVKQISAIANIAFDMANLPMAHGVMRMAQIANVNLLKSIDRICRENGINYFVIGGGIVGLLRHGGKCIPWDDDCDIGMLSGDFIKFINVIEKFLPNKSFQIKRWPQLLRIEATDFSCFIDILAYVSYESPDCYANPELLTCCLRRFRRHVRIGKKLHLWHRRHVKVSYAWEKKKMRFGQIRDDFARLCKLHADYMSPAICSGKHQTIIPLAWDCKLGEFYDFDTIFPLRECDFEGIRVMFPNDPEIYAAKCWGDIYKFPNDIGRLHSTSKKLSVLQKILVLRKLNSMTDEERFAMFKGCA
ncbi:MAG: LicD family protein [Rickettsiales bacterium]|nr:LicD family protein [Rickettsiales bacterium]